MNLKNTVGAALSVVLGLSLWWRVRWRIRSMCKRRQPKALLSQPAKPGAKSLRRRTSTSARTKFSRIRLREERAAARRGALLHQMLVLP